MALVLRNITGDTQGCADGVAITDTRFGAFDVGTSARGHQENSDALSVLGSLGKSLSERRKPLGESGFRSGRLAGRFCFSDTSLHGGYRILPQPCADQLFTSRVLHFQPGTDRPRAAQRFFDQQHAGDGQHKRERPRHCQL